MNGKDIKEARPYAPGRGEEIASSVTHGLGAGLAVAALVLMVVLAARHGDAWRVVSLAIFGSTLILLYTASALYHGLTNPTAKRVFQVLDHSCIYLLIAGTYTPLTLVPLRGPWGWSLFGVVWGMALVGVVFKAFFTARFEAVSVALYLLMGWLIVVAARPVMRDLPPGMLLWIVLGGLAYTLGVFFYVNDRRPYFHAIWHLFVLGGSTLHFFGIILHLPVK